MAYYPVHITSPSSEDNNKVKQWTLVMLQEGCKTETEESTLHPLRDEDLVVRIMLDDGICLFQVALPHRILEKLLRLALGRDAVTVKTNLATEIKEAESQDILLRWIQMFVNSGRSLFPSSSVSSAYQAAADCLAERRLELLSEITKTSGSYEAHSVPLIDLFYLLVMHSCVIPEKLISSKADQSLANNVDAQRQEAKVRLESLISSPPGEDESTGFVSHCTNEIMMPAIPVVVQEAEAEEGNSTPKEGKKGHRALFYFLEEEWNNFVEVLSSSLSSIQLEVIHAKNAHPLLKNVQRP